LPRVCSAHDSFHFMEGPFGQIFMANRISILMYHQVGEFPPMRKHRANYCDHRRFAGQMAFLKGFGYRVLDLDQVLACVRGEQSIPPRAMALTFDDGYANFVSHALPVLRHYGFPATVFAISGQVEAGTVVRQGPGTTDSHADERWPAKGNPGFGHNRRFPYSQLPQAR